MNVLDCLRHNFSTLRYNEWRWKQSRQGKNGVFHKIRCKSWPAGSHGENPRERDKSSWGTANYIEVIDYFTPESVRWNWLMLNKKKNCLAMQCLLVPTVYWFFFSTLKYFIVTDEIQLTGMKYSTFKLLLPFQYKKLFYILNHQYISCQQTST